MKEEVRAQLMLLHNEELHGLYGSPRRPVVRLVGSRRLHWTRNIAGIGDTRNVYRILEGTLIKKAHTRSRKRRTDGS
jgi:hypothetical protein